MAYNTNGSRLSGSIIKQIGETFKNVFADKSTVNDMQIHQSAPPVTITVGTAGSKKKHYCDYICTGTDDHLVIQQAIDALPSGGGKIVLLEGTYNIGGTITVNKDNVTLEGMGDSTILKRKVNSKTLIKINANNVSISKVQINENKDSYENYNNYGIHISSGEHIEIRNTNIIGVTGSGIVVGERYKRVKYSKIIGNKIIGNNKAGKGIEVNTSNNCIIACNKILNTRNYGIQLYINCTNHQIMYNSISSDSSDISGGITCHASANSNMITGNIIKEVSAGISINSDGSNNNISNNHITVTTKTASPRTIEIGASGTNNFIFGNTLVGRNYVNSGGETNTFADNKFIEEVT